MRAEQGHRIRLTVFCILVLCLSFLPKCSIYCTYSVKSVCLLHLSTEPLSIGFLNNGDLRYYFHENLIITIGTNNEPTLLQLRSTDRGSENYSACLDKKLPRDRVCVLPNPSSAWSFILTELHPLSSDRGS